jgi:hypothetical protein
MKICVYSFHCETYEVAATTRSGYATGGFVPGWNVYVNPHLPQYWRSSWNDIYKNKSISVVLATQG